MKFKYLLATSAVGLSAAVAAPASAQSTGSVDFEEENVIVVSGARATDVGGVDIPDTPKAKQVLTEEIIRRQRPGQTVNDIVNLVPGVSFQNNDPWGSGGGGFTIRGFGADRISQTLDGIPLNDTGNYALYTNQQVDSEIIDNVNVNLGVTDIDSPTASASGGTINIRTREPDDELGVTATASYGNIFADGAGDRPYVRLFGMLDTGDITGSGTKAFFSGSWTSYDNPFNNYGKVKKQQYNARIWQDLGSNGDFIAIAGHYNENRNNFFGSSDILSIRDDIEAGDKKGRFYDINYPCSVDLPTAGVRDLDNNCGAEFDRRYNPSNTGNIRGASRFTLSDNLTLTVDPSYQYVKANGGGDEELLEQRCYFAEVRGRIRCTTEDNGTQGYTGFIGGGYYFGQDINGDGDTLDEVTGNDPSQTQTHRYAVISNLIYDINDDHRVRLAYTYERARHRQTGQTSVALANGEIADVFPINDPLLTADGFELNKRNRKSYTILHQVSGEYRGEFGPLTAVLGLRAPFFTRELNQYCYTTTVSGFVDCFANQDAAEYEAANPNAAPPESRTYKYDKLLPSVGLTYDFADASVFANYSKGLSVPGTDPLYDSLYVADARSAQPVPETTDSFDLGLRYRTGDITAQVAGWYTRYNNRLASAYDPILDETIYRNLGRVDKYGIDVSVGWFPEPQNGIYLFGSYNDSEIKEDVEGADGFLATAGSRESGSAKWLFGARGQIALGPVELGAQVKYTGERFVNDLNLETVPSYTLVDFDMRYNLGEIVSGKDAAIQLNLTNVFDEYYVGYYGGSLDSTPFAQQGAPRAAQVSLVIGY
ncbi:MAG: TonB-dependent receptor [Citromicrobium sp.]|nr:MAG: TonB-dependent receptor [Citromicrobium sp.]